MTKLKYQTLSLRSSDIIIYIMIVLIVRVYGNINNYVCDILYFIEKLKNHYMRRQLIKKIQFMNSLILLLHINLFIKQYNIQCITAT